MKHGMRLVQVGCALALLATAAHAAEVRVRCERRAARSRASVDGNNLAPGIYQARVSSGANLAVSPQAATVGDEVGFDFDSNRADIRAGATAISANFIQGGQVTGALLDANGAVVAQATVTCRSR
jgi:hypothetical protein